MILYMNKTTKPVTCKDITVGDEIICTNYVEDETTGIGTFRTEVPMIVGQIITNDTGISQQRCYRYLTVNGEYINFAGGSSRVRKVVK